MFWLLKAAEFAGVYETHVSQPVNNRIISRRTGNTSAVRRLHVPWCVCVVSGVTVTLID